jgi:hypothetical protein
MSKFLKDTKDPIDPTNKQNEELNEDVNDDFMDDSIDESLDVEDGMSGDIVIEIDDDILDDIIATVVEDDEIKLEFDDTDVSSDSIEDDEDIIMSKHKIQGKHSLKYDSIFKGKKEDPLSDEEFDTMTSFYNENFEVDKGSLYWFESIDNENYVKEKRIKEKVYEVLSSNTDLNFLNNRRKPSKSDFNNYYFLIKSNLKDENFSNTELFNELAVYFSDNLFNMFKLLDNKWRNLIIIELEDHIGKYNTNPEVTVKNLTVGTEVEFLWKDIITDEMQIITGIIVDIEDNLFIVDSMENIYNLELDQISKILNNNKFKYNLNKLNNTDFL